MEFYVKPCAAESSLFAVYGAAGELLYQITGENSALSGKLYLIDSGGRETAKIRRLGTSEISRYSIFVQGKEQAGVLQNFIGAKPVYRLYGVPWSFRGDVLSRSFDVIDVDGGVLMTHGRCWKGRERGLPRWGPLWAFPGAVGTGGNGALPGGALFL